MTNSLLPDENARDIGMTGVVRDVESNRSDTQRMMERLSRVEEMMAERARQEAQGNARSRDQQVRQEMESLRKQVEDLKKNGVAAPQGALGNGQMNGSGAPPQAPDEPEEHGYGAIRSIGAPAPAKSASAAAKKPAGKVMPPPPQMYLPSGSVITGVMLTGLDAPTGKGALKDPVPVLVRIQKEAILPNLFRADVRECFALVAGQGDLASERAYLRSESISCVRKDKTVIDLGMKAYVVDTDGKAGLRGRLVSKQGSVLSKAILASFADGVAQAFKGGNNNNFSEGSLNAGAAMESGAVMGVSSSLDRISKYYLDLADQLFPILEIDAGRKVTLVLVKGLEMSSVR